MKWKSWITVALGLAATAITFWVLGPATPSPGTVGNAILSTDDPAQLADLTSENDEAQPIPMLRNRRTKPYPGEHPQHSSELAAKPATPERPEWLDRLLSGASTGHLPPETVNKWIERNGTNVDSLLAAGQVNGDKEYLSQALELYPNDPKVLCASIRLDDSPAIKRERLDRFKAAAPDNALPYYLSAREHLKQSEPDKAVADLLKASQLNRFDDYTLEAMQSAEELYLSAGLAPGEAKAMGGSSVLLPHLAQLKALGTGLMEMRDQYVAGGDAQSAQNLAQYCLELGDHLVSGEGSRFAINQLVGVAIQQIALNKLDPAQSYAFLPDGVGERKAALSSFKESIKQDNKIVEQWFTTADEQRLMNYFDRIKLYGERNAFEWVKNAK